MGAPYIYDVSRLRVKILNCCARRDVSSQCLFTNGCVIRFKGSLNNILLKKIKLPSLMLRVSGEIKRFAVVYSVFLTARTFVGRESKCES